MKAEALIELKWARNEFLNEFSNPTFANDAYPDRNHNILFTMSSHHATTFDDSKGTIIMCFDLI